MTVSTQQNRYQWHEQFPEIGTGPLSVDPILSQEVFEQQRDHVFKKSWLYVGRVDQIPKRGDYFVARIDIAKASVIIVRQPDGGIGAFHNVCMHRGNKLVWNASGNCGRYLACNFHGWVFDTAGNVADIPDFENFYDLDKSKLSLRPVRIDVWQGFIFINLDSEGTESLESFLGEVVDRVKGYPFDRLPTRTMWRTDVRCNWMIIADAQAEAYHVPYLHKNSVQGVFTGADNPHTHILHFEPLGLHSTMAIPFDPNAEPAGIESLVFKYGSSLVQTHEADSYDIAPGLNPTGVKNWQFIMFHIFPNFNLLLFRDSYIIHQFWPVAVDRATWEVSLYQPEAQTAAELFCQEQTKCVLREAVTEDGGTHERTQEAIESGAIGFVQLKDEEIAVRHGYVVLDQVIAEATA